MTLREQVTRKREEILRLAEQYGASNVRLFGSVARGEESPDSDIDLLVTFDNSLLRLIAFERELRDLLSCEVDVVVEGGLSPYLKEEIMNSAVPL